MRLLLVVCLAAALTSCSDDAASPGDQTSGSPSPRATTPSASPTSSPSASPRAAATMARDGDVDGDGRIDVIRPEEGVLTVTLSGSGRSVSVEVHQESPGRPGLLGSRDVDRDGFAEVFLETAAGSSTTFATPYRFDGRSLRELQLNGEPAKLGIGGSVTHGDGFACLDNGLLEVRSADSQDGATYQVTISTYRLGPAELALASRTTVDARQGEPAVEASYQVRCGSVGDGG